MSGFSFGASKPAFGASAPTFGSAATTSTPSLSFGLPAPSTAPGVSFGSSTTSGFGTATQSTFGGFGSSAGTAKAPSFGFGSTATSTAPSFGASAGGTTFGGFGATSAAPSFGFGSTATTATGGFGFGSTNTTSAPSFGTSFGFGAGAKPAFGGLGTTSTGLGTGLGSTFGTGSTFGATGTSGAAFGGFGAPQQHVQQQPSEADLIYLCVTDHAKVFGDERDSVVIRWNQTQGFWGFGKGWYSSSQSPVVFKPTNAFARFKAIVYYKMHCAKDEDGFVGLIINKPFPEVELLKMQLQDSIMKAVMPGVTNPQQSNMKVCLESMKPLPENRTDAVIYFVEKTPMGTEVRVPAKKAHSVLKQQQVFQTLSTAINLIDVNYRCRMSPEDLDAFLKIPPSGLEPIMWEQAKKDNPDPKTMIPQVVTGFDGLLERFKHQSVEAEQQQFRMDIIAENVEEMRQRSLNLLNKLRGLEANQKQLTHRILRLLCRQEVVRKQGQSLTREEEEFFGSQMNYLCGLVGFVPAGLELLQPKPKLAQTGLGGDQVEEHMGFPSGLRAALNTLLTRVRLCPMLDDADRPIKRASTISTDTLTDMNQVLDSLTKALNMLQNTVKEDAKNLTELRSKMARSAPQMT